MQFFGYNLSQTSHQESSGTATYTAERNADRAVVWIKYLDQAIDSETSLSRLQNEYAMTQALDHPGVGRSLEWLTEAGAVALVLEYPGGRSLANWQSGRSAELSDAATGLTLVFAVAVQLAKLLDYLESQRVVHQAIHPGNIWVDPFTTQVTLVNFESAVRLSEAGEAVPSELDASARLAYIAPEQTGRTSRGVDGRTDFYGLGVVLYELLVGQLPFDQRDPTAVLYAHLAQVPRPPHRVKSSIPVMLSQVVMRLLAKDPAARYQSAAGLLADLARCSREWHGDRAIPEFALGQHDRRDRFMIPDRIYGRSAMVDQLLMQFYQISHHPQKSLVLIAGDAGVGKTAIVNQVQPQIARQKGYFSRGKFDQLNRQLPLSAVVEALRDLVHQWLTQPDGLQAGADHRQLAYWRAKLRAALGDEAAVLLAVLPELGQIIGSAVPVPVLSGEAAGHRFNLVLSRLIRAIAQPQHPLVIFLDDLQWADGASLAWMQRLLLDHQLGNLLLIGAYRHAMVPPSHALSQMRQALLTERVPIVELMVTALPETVITEIVADTLNCPVARAAPLSAEIWRRTQGNPFFSRQMFTAFYQDQLIQYDWAAQCWQCDLTQISQLPLTAEVVEFMLDRLQKLAPETRWLLSFAACLGNHFDLATLAIVAGQRVADTRTLLWPAFQLGLLLPTQQTYRFDAPAVGSPVGSAIATIHPAIATYRFLHDRVQQAAYELLPIDDQPAIHLRLGRRLRQHLRQHLQGADPSLVQTLTHPPTADQTAGQTDRAAAQWRVDRQILAMINQLNQGVGLITDRAERVELAELNWVAARRAFAATAYQTALTGAWMGITLLGASGWQQDYALQLALHELAAETAYLCGAFSQTPVLVTTIQQRCEHILDTIPACDIQIKAHIAAGDPHAAMRFGLQILRQLGIQLPQHPNKIQAVMALCQTQLLLWRQPPRQLGQLPLMSDRWAIGVAQILQPLAYIAVMAQPHLIPFCALTSIQLARKFGNSANLAYAYTSHGMLRSIVGGDFNAGQRFGQLALVSLDRAQDKAALPRIQVALAMAIDHWQMPLRQVAAAMPPVYQACLATGQLEMAAWALQTHAFCQYFAGTNLADLAQELAEYDDTVRQFNQLAVLRLIRCTRYCVALLQGKATALTDAAGATYDIDQLLIQAIAAQNWTEVMVHHICRSLKHAIAGEHALAYADLQTAYPYLNTLGSLPHLPVFHYQMALAAAAYADTAAAHQQSAIRRTLKRSLKSLKLAAQQCPANYGSKFYQAQAEWHRLNGDRLAAIGAYDRAIALAETHPNISDLAQADELAGRFYVSWQPSIAKVYLTQAQDHYQTWGAIAKVNYLLQTYPAFLVTPSTPPMTDGRSLTIAPGRPNPLLPSPETLALRHAMGAARSIAAPITLTPLLQNLMRIVLQESGADRGVLLLGESAPGQPQQWQIYVDTTDPQQPLVLDPPIGFMADDNAPNRLPHELLQYVSHTQETLTINASALDAASASTGANPLPLRTFQQQSYFQHYRPQSLLVLPLRRQRCLVGLLYLENRQIEGLFGADRVELLELLVAQAAIAIGNAQFHQANQAYIQQLEQTQAVMLKRQSGRFGQEN
jgi:predicted ATPase/GAF domain-containing protein